MNKESPQLSPSKKNVEVSDQSHPPHLRILLKSFGHFNLTIQLKVWDGIRKTHSS